MAQAHVIADASALICLSWVGQLELLPALFGRIFVPPAVAGEASARDVSALGLALGQHTLEDVVTALGAAKRVHTGDASESEYSVCYSTSSGEVIAFVSNVEMAVPPLSLTAIRLGSASQLSGACSSLKQRPIRLSNGLVLGMTRAEIEAALGIVLKPASALLEHSRCVAVPFEKGTAEYDRWANARGCFGEGEPPHADVCSSVEVMLKSGRAVWLEVSRIESIC